MKRTQKFALLFALMLLSALFAIQASATTLDEYKANNSQLDFSATEELTAAQKNTFEEALAEATTLAGIPYSSVVKQEVVDALALASKVIAYEGLQARLSEGADGIRSRYSVDRAALAALEEYGAVSFGAIMGIAEKDGETGLNSSDGLKVFFDKDQGWIASGYRTTSVVVYDKGVDTGAYTDGDAKSHFAYTTIYDEEYANGAAYSGIAMVYRGFVVVNVSGTDYVLYVDGIGENFGAEGTMNGAATTLSELAQYMVEVYKEDGVRVYEQNAKLRNILWGEGVHNFDVAGDDGSRVCLDCGHVDKPILEAPSADVADFTVEVTDFDGKITVPADKIGASGFYWVTLEGVTDITTTKVYNYLYNENGKLYASKNRDPGDGASYSVYLEAGKDNVLTYEGQTLTRANFKLAEPTSADTIMMTSGKDDLTANTVTNAGFKDNTSYQMRKGSVLNYKKTVKITEGGFFTIGAALSNATAGETFFTFTAENGLSYTASFKCASIAGATGVAIVTSGSESYCYAADLAAVYLTAGEYSLTVSMPTGNYMSIGVITMNPVSHMCRDAVPYVKEPTCTENGLTGAGCPICLNGVTIVPAKGHDWDEGVYTKPSCEVDGGTLYTCTVCSETKTDVEAAPGHAWDEGTETLKPGCTTPGITTFKCTVCTEGVKTEPIKATGHAWGDWVANAEETEETRTCGTCGTPETRPIVNDGKTIYPTFTTTDNKTWKITVPGEQIAFTGIYRFNLVGSGVTGKYIDITTSSDKNIYTGMKITMDGNTFTSWHETLVVAKDENGDGKNDDVVITLVDRGGANLSFTEITMSLVGKVVAYTTTNPNFAAYTSSPSYTVNNGTISAAAGTYTVGAFFNGANSWTCTVDINGTSFTDQGTNKSGTTALGNYHNGSVQHNGSTNTAGMKIMGEITFDSDVADITVSTSATGQFITGAGKKIVPVFLMILAEDLQ